MARNGPTTLALPPFAGATRRLILWNVSAFFAYFALAILWPRGLAEIQKLLVLQPEHVAHGFVWQVLTYSFMPLGLLSTLFAMLTLWFIGEMLEGTFGARWLYELYFSSAIGGAVVASAFSYTHLFGITPQSIGAGPYGGIFGLLIAVAVFFGDQEFLFLFILRIRARYLVAIYILFYLATLLTSAGQFQALIQLAGGLCGYAYLKFAPRRGFNFSLTERYYAVRNEYYRAKRRNAAKKFEVYMGKQGREVHFDKNGKYVAPEDRDPTDKRWMN